MEIADMAIVDRTAVGNSVGLTLARSVEIFGRGMAGEGRGRRIGVTDGCG
ncbi:MAG: hypothetical protein M0002_14605 [Rhodospirillales bacterium]|nr:hypothetical protein [Rhodospirillales bacterium]